jgi:hypothetical protein
MAVTGHAAAELRRIHTHHTVPEAGIMEGIQHSHIPDKSKAAVSAMPPPGVEKFEWRQCDPADIPECQSANPGAEAEESDQRRTEIIMCGSQPRPPSPA